MSAYADHATKTIQNDAANVVANLVASPLVVIFEFVISIIFVPERTQVVYAWFIFCMGSIVVSVFVVGGLVCGCVGRCVFSHFRTPGGW